MAKKKSFISKTFDMLTNPDVSDQGWDMGYKAGLNGKNKDYRSIILSAEARRKALIHASTPESFNTAYDEGYLQGQRDRMHQTVPQLVTTTTTTRDQQTDYSPSNNKAMSLDELIKLLEQFSTFQNNLVTILDAKKKELKSYKGKIEGGAGNFLPYYRQQLESVLPEFEKSIRDIQQMIVERTNPATRRTISTLEQLGQGRR